MLADLPLSELQRYRPDVPEPADFSAFWTDQLQAARLRHAEPSFRPADSAVRHAAVFDVTFAGYAGDPVRAWLLVPHQAGPGAAVIVQYIGYGGGRGDPFDWLTWKARCGSGAVLGRPRRRHHAAVNRLCRVQPLRRAQGHRRLPL